MLTISVWIPSVYSTATNSAQQSGVQTQQYSPARYPTTVQGTAGISPCYPQGQAQIISPTQAPTIASQPPSSSMGPAVVPNAASIPRMEVPGGGGAIAPQHVRIIPQSAPFFGHANAVLNSYILVQGDMCLIGCFFIVIEHERILVDRLDVQEIGAVVRLHGGEIEFGPRAYNSVNSERVTHIICESMRHHLVQQALKERKRCITLQWLNDVVAKKRLEVPWRVSHLPSLWAENHRPAAGKIIAIRGFCENERSGIKLMINAIGARYTPYLTRHNHFLITKSNDSEIIEKCREYGVTVVNYQWLVDIYLGLKNVVNENENCYFPMPNMVSEVNVSPYALEHFSDLCKQLLAPWRSPIIFTNEQWQRANEIKRNVENDENIFPNKKLRCSTPPPTEEDIAMNLGEIEKLEEIPVVCFTGFTSEEMDALGRKIRFLGGKITDSVMECTHLVALNLWRTMKLLQAIALGKNVVGPNWITDGYRYRTIPGLLFFFTKHFLCQFSDTMDYFMRDDENEKCFGYNLKYSILRARCRKIFQDVMFYLTPSVEPSYSALSSLIILAGGKVLEDKPQPQFVIRCIEVLLPFNTDSPLLLISNESDIHLLQYLMDSALPVFNVEIVLTGILRQKLENSPLYRVPVTRPSTFTPSPSQNSRSKTPQITMQRITA
ncbi:unnamed protein product [Dracunculus medinensis]|uniref:PAX-interacting protein 1 n=1 Tax=Dracunculus medinensis TaxID=318479 RepID=A0A0N4U0D0_DRAME|nr:unnamed protein product [Dracunculus medinensis]